MQSDKKDGARSHILTFAVEFLAIMSSVIDEYVYEWWMC